MMIQITTTPTISFLIITILNVPLAQARYGVYFALPEIRMWSGFMQSRMLVECEWFRCFIIFLRCSSTYPDLLL